MALSIEIHKPPVAVDIPDNELQIFLAGPIQGAPDWQQQATEMLADRLKHEDATIHIANPRRGVFRQEGFDYDAYKEQVGWEKTSIKRAARLGAVLFWFAAESTEAPAPNRPDRQYAKTTIKELHRAVGWKDYDAGINLVVGIEPGFNERLRYDRLCIEEFALPVHTSLADVVGAIIESLSK